MSIPEGHKTHTSPPKITPDPHKYATDLDIHATASYNTLITHRSILMSVSYLQGRKQKVRITLELEVFQDFNARDIDFEKLFKLEPSESVDVYVEEFDGY